MSDSCWSRLTLLVVRLLLAGRTVMAAGESSAPDAAEPALGPWYATGPFDTRQFDEVLPPERAVDLQASAGGVPALAAARGLARRTGPLAARQFAGGNLSVSDDHVAAADHGKRHRWAATTALRSGSMATASGPTMFPAVPGPTRTRCNSPSAPARTSC